MTAIKPANAAMLRTQPVATNNSNNTKVILSADLGRTATKACIGRAPSEVVFIPSNVARLSVEQARGGNFEAKETDSLLDVWLEYLGKGYALGQLAADFGAKLFGEGQGQSKVEDAIIKVLACAGYFDLKGEIDVVLGLPYYSQEQFEREKAEIISQLKSPHILIYRGKPAVNLDIRNVWVMPEGYGSLIWSEAQNSKEFEPELSKLSLAIVDIGHQTTDLLMVDQFRFARAASKSDPLAMGQFYKDVAAKIKEKEGIEVDAQSLALLHAVHKSEGHRSFRPRGATKPINLDDIAPEVRKAFAVKLSERLIHWIPERVTDVLLTGGGGEFFRDDLERLLKEANIKSHLATPSRQANALGQFIYAEAQLAAAANKSPT